MNMDTDIFWSALLGTSLPAILVSSVVLFLTHRTNRSLEYVKGEIQTNSKLSLLSHEQEVSALVNLHESFRKFIDFTRRRYYVKSGPVSMDQMWEFYDSIEKELVFLRPQNRKLIKKYQGELVAFWNWAASQPEPESVSAETELQHRLDFEIPGHLERVRELIDVISDREPSAQQGTPADAKMRRG